MGGSSKSLEIVDMSTGKIARTFPEAHGKPVHTIFMNNSSPYVQHPRESYDLFLTSAADNTIKLWDLRTEKYCLFISQFDILRVVRLFQGHVNRVQQVGLSFSPCLRYVSAK